MTNVIERVHEHAVYAEKSLPDFKRFFTALQGSQNYKLNDAESDVDTKSLMIPSFKNLLFDKKRLSSTLLVEPTIEHADVKDLREMFENFRKQNINFLEILFSAYVDINPDFMNEWKMLHENREMIAHMNPYRALRTTIGHLNEKYHAFDHPYPAAVEKIKKFGYDPKQLHHMVRFKEFLTRFFREEESYESALIPRDPETLRAIKRGSIPYAEAVILREEIRIWADKFYAQEATRFPNEENLKAKELMDEVVYQVLKKSYQQEEKL